MKKKLILSKVNLVAACMLMSSLMSAGSLASDGLSEETVQLCASCHGEDGVSSINAWPNLAGQKQGYLADQLKAFRDGERSDPQMSAAADGLTDKEITKLAAYYSKMEGEGSDASLATLNEAGRHVRANCVSCHGMEGRTVNQQWPNLAGQNRDYLIKQLKQFRDGSRPSIMMFEIAKELSDDDIENVAEYYSQLDSK